MMQNVFRSKWVTAGVLLAMLTPIASAAHDESAPAAYVAADPLYRIAADPWAGGAWVAGPGLFFHGDDGGFAHLGVRDGIPTNEVYDVMATPTKVWVNTRVGPAVMDKADGLFRSIETESGHLFAYEGRSVWAEQDAAWIGTDSEGLFRVDPVLRVATPVPNPVNGTRFDHPILGIAADGPLLFISATGYGLVEWDRSTGESRHFNVTFLEQYPLYGRIRVDPSTAWVGTSGDGVIAVDRVTGDSVEYSGPYTVNARHIYGLAKLGSEQWFATDAGVSRYDVQKDSWRYWQGMPWGSANDVAVIDGEVYAATSRGHIIQYDRAHDGWRDAHWWGGDKVLPHNSVLGCTADGEELIVSTGGGGAMRYLSSGSWEKIGGEGNTTQKPLDILVWETVVSEDYMWVASHKGISIVDRETGTWGHVRTDHRQVGHIVDNPVRDIHVDADGAWAATASHKMVRGPERGEIQPGNLAHWDAEQNVWTRYDRSSGLADDSVMRVDVAGGKVWIGLAEKGVDVLDMATGGIQHVWPADGSEARVMSLLALPGAVWVGTSKGLHRIDPVTLETTPVPGLTGLAVSSLMWDDGRLWVGAVLGGVHRYDPASGQVESFRTGMIIDASGLCLVRNGGILYVGTQWGVDRLDIERGRWLPQDGSVGLPSVQPVIRISEPAAGATYAPGDTVTLRGTAQVPKGAWIEVGVAGEWVRATGTGSWSARFSLDEAFSGPLSLSARIYDGQRTLVQDAVRLTVQTADTGATSLDFVHEQVLRAEQGSTIPFIVGYEPQDADVTGWVELRLPSSTQTVTVPLQSGVPGVLSGESPVLENLGEASYTIRLEWDDGKARLPVAYGGSGVYKVAVQEVSGKPIGFLSLVRCDDGIAPGESGEITFKVQNTGTRGGRMEVNFAGPASPWITEVPEPFELPPSQTHFVRVPVAVPEDTSFGPHDLYIGAGPVERTEGSVHVTTCGFVVGEAEETQADTQNITGGPGEATPDERTSHPGLLMVMMVFVVAWVRRR